MKVILTTTDSKGKNIAFTTDSLQTLSAKQAVKLAKQGKIDDVHVVNTKEGKYIRSDPNAVSWDNLDHLSLSMYGLLKGVDNIHSLVSHPGFNRYWKHYTDNLLNLQLRREEIIYINGKPRTPKRNVIKKFRSVQKHIINAAENYEIDQATLGAILVDEIARLVMFEEVADAAGFVGMNTSVGFAQVKIETARGLIRNGYYNPNLKDQKLSKKNVSRAPRSHIYSYLSQPKHNIYFGAAKIRSDIDRWKSQTGEDISLNPDKIGYLYSRGPVVKIMPDGRARQISNEFYPLAHEILTSK